MQLAPSATKRRTNASSWPAVCDVERGGRLVEDDEPQRIVGDGEGARHLDHLALADRQIADHVGRPDAVAGKDLVELGEDEIAGAAAPAEAAAARHD